MLFQVDSSEIKDRGLSQFGDKPNFYLSDQSVEFRTIKTSQRAERVILAETLPRIRSKAFSPVAPQTIKSASTSSAIFLGMIDFGFPNSSFVVTSVIP